MYFNDYLKQLNKNTNSLSINFDNHFYLTKDKDNAKNYEKTLKIWQSTISKLFNFVLNIYNYEIKGYPDIPPEIIELGFVLYGGIAIGKDAVGDIEILPARPTNKVNKYGRTEKIILTGFNGYNVEYTQIYDKKDFKNKTCIYVEDNDFNFLSSKYIFNYGETITDKLRALQVATQKLKQPFIFQTDKKKVNNLKDFYEKLEENKPLILITDVLTESETELQNYNVNPDTIKAIKESILFDVAQFLEIYGINTDPNPDKMERKIVDEVNSNNDYLNILATCRTKKRVEFIKKAKEICGLDIQLINNMKIDDGKEKEDNIDANDKRAKKIQDRKNKTKKATI